MSKPWSLTFYEWRNGLAIRLLGAAPDDARCIMGSPISPSAHCRRWAGTDRLWCPKHAAELGEAHSG